MRVVSAWGRTIDAKVLSQQGLAAPYGAATMTLRPSRATPRRPMLLVLVYAAFLLLIGLTAAALVAVTSGNLSTATLNAVISRDASLIELFVNGTLRSGDVDASGPTPARAAEIERQLTALSAGDGIERIDLRRTDGTVLASDQAGARGQRVAPAADGVPSRASVAMSADGTALEESLPIVDGSATRWRSSPSGVMPLRCSPASTRPGGTSCSSCSRRLSSSPSCCSASSAPRRRGSPASSGSSSKRPVVTR